MMDMTGASGNYWVDLFLELAKALAAPIIAIGALWVSSIQAGIAKSKLSLDMYDRRLDVYEAVKQLYASAGEDSELTFVHLRDFRTGVADADFLFRQEVQDFLEWLDKQVVDYIKKKRRGELLKKLGTDEHAAADAQLEVIRAFMNFLGSATRAKTVFRKELKLI